MFDLAMQAREQVCGLQEERNRAVDALRAADDWTSEKSRYELRDLGDGFTSGIFAYGLKDDQASNEPAHSICPDCYQRGAKAILQRVTRSPGMCQVAICQQCNWEAYVSGHWRPEHAGVTSSPKNVRPAQPTSRCPSWDLPGLVGSTSSLPINSTILSGRVIVTTGSPSARRSTQPSGPARSTMERLSPTAVTPNNCFPSTVTLARHFPILIFTFGLIIFNLSSWLHPGPDHLA
jgi:hypothetical protein